MYAIVYLNTAVPVFASAKLTTSQKHRYSWLLRLLIPLKNSLLRHSLRDRVCRYRRWVSDAIQQQSLVFNRFMAGAL